MLPVTRYVFRAVEAVASRPAVRNVQKGFVSHVYIPPVIMPSFDSRRHIMTMPVLDRSMEARVVVAAQAALAPVPPVPASRVTGAGREASLGFSTVRSIQSHLREKGCAVVYGAPGSGKTEQMALASGKPSVIFDLRQEYYNYCLSNALRKAEEREGRLLSSEEVEDFDNAFWSDWIEGYEDHKPEELKWLRENYSQIRDHLIEKKESVVILDEIDLVKGDLKGPSLESALLMVDLAKELVAAGKQTLITLHSAGVEQPILTDHMSSAGLIDAPSQIIKTQFLSVRDQFRACIAMGFSKEDAERAVAHTQGVPGAYLHFLKRAQVNMKYFPTYEEFIIDAHHQIERNFKAIKKSSSPEVLALLQKMAACHSLDPLEEGISEAMKQKLLDTALVFFDGKSLIMPEAVSLVIARQVPHTEHLSAVTKYEPIGLDVPKPLEASGGDRPEDLVYDKAMHIVSRLGGGRILRMDEKAPIIIPKSLALLQMLHSGTKKMVADYLEITGRFPEESHFLEHKAWTNSGRSVDDILSTAYSAQEPFLSVLSAACHGVGEVYTGEDHQFLFKHKTSLERKVALWSEAGVTKERALSTLNDTIRATIIVHDLKGMREAITEFYRIATESGWKVVFSDKFKENYESGYVAVHAKVLLEGESGRIMGEVQFHLRQIHDGSTSSIKELSHRVLDDYTRPMADPGQKEAFKRMMLKDWGVDATRLESPKASQATMLGLVLAAQKTLFTTGLVDVRERTGF